MRLRQLENGSYIADEDPGENGSPHRRVSVTDMEGHILAWLARDYRVLEIGTGLGISTAHMAQSARHVVTVDPDEWVAANITPLLERNYGIGCFQSVEEIQGKFDLVFIDGAHDTESVRKDIRTARRVLARGGLLVLHDWKMESVQLAIVAEGLNVVAIETTHGLGMVFL